MATFLLRILTPEKVLFEQDVEAISVQTEDGERGFRARHESCMLALPVGCIRVQYEGKTVTAAISGGVLRINNVKKVGTLLANACEWAGDIDVERAKRAEENARALLEAKESHQNLEIAGYQLKRAINRLRVAAK